MNNPLNDNTLKFQLNFKNEGSFGLIDTTEQVKFDGIGFVVKQESKRYGRDISYMGDNIDLFFYKGVYDVAENPLMLPDGTIINHLSQGFEHLIEAIKIYGFELECEYILKKSGLTWVTGVLDVQGYDTDDSTFIKCKVVQNTNKQIVKRNEDIVVNVFDDEDINGNPITPLTTENILLKAKPETQISEWSLPNTYSIHLSNSGYFQQQQYYNYINNTISYGIDESLGFIQGLYDDTNNISDFVYINALSNLTDVVVNISEISIEYALEAPQFTYIDFNIYYLVSDTFDYSEKQLIHNEYKYLFDPSHIDSYTFLYDGVLNITNGIPLGNKLWIWFEADTGLSSPVTTLNNYINFNGGNINITATSTSIDSVIKGVRYIGLIKKNVESISGLDVYAPKFDYGGKFYDQFAFTGNLIKQRDTSFPIKFKDAISTLWEVNADYQILDDKIFIGQFDDFYPNKEIGVFAINPDESLSKKYNPRFTLNQFEFKYKTYEKDRDEENTIDTVHTESQWKIPNLQVENSKKIDLLQIRCTSKTEATRKDGLKETTATTDDDKPFLFDVVALSPSATGVYSVPLRHNVNNDDNLQLLNDATYKWGLLGFNLNDSFTLIDTSNAGTYTVIEITNNVITLQPTTTTPTSLNDVTLTNISYPYTNVAYTNRTNEGFDEINGIASPDRYGNLKYTIKRNMREWFSYLSTAFRFASGQLRNTYFKNNGELETRMTGETSLTIENAHVDKVDLGTPKLTPNTYNLIVVASFESALNLQEAMNTINDDDTIGGFVRVFDSNKKVVKGYVQKMEYEPANEVLTLDLEERYEDENLVITTDDGILTINEVGYDIETIIGQIWEINNDYLQLFDSDYAPIINPVRYDFVTINGETFSNSGELSNKLIEIS